MMRSLRWPRWRTIWPTESRSWTTARRRWIIFIAGGNSKARAGGNPIVVLLDNKMPKVSGLEVLKIIKGDGHLKMIPVVALTSSRRTQDLIEFYEHGVNAYVVKPLDFSEFRAAIKQLVVFWAAVNEPPPPTGREEASIQSDEVASLWKGGG